jgi:predicted Zn-ribbon and HTH transcriptional regulator
MKAIERIVLACKRCGHEWVRRNLSTLTGTCPKCCSPYWDKPRKNDE